MSEMSCGSNESAGVESGQDDETGTVAELGLKRATRGDRRGGRRGGAVKRITQRRKACSAVRIDQDNISNVSTIQITGLPVRIDQEVEMTDRGEESSPYIQW